MYYNLQIIYDDGTEIIAESCSIDEVADLIEEHEGAIMFSVLPEEFEIFEDPDGGLDADTAEHHYVRLAA